MTARQRLHRKSSSAHLRPDRLTTCINDEYLPPNDAANLIMSKQTTSLTTTGLAPPLDARYSHEEELPSICLTAVDKRSIVRITLEGPILILCVAGLCIGVHIFSPSIIASLITISVWPYIIHNDYQAYLSLGPGGTPSTFMGYLKITYLRLLTLSFDPLVPPVLEGSIQPANGLLQQFPARLSDRDGPRPTIAGIAPQRQLDQPGSLRAYETMCAAFILLAQKHPDQLRTGVSEEKSAISTVRIAAFT